MLHEGSSDQQADHSRWGKAAGCSKHESAVVVSLGAGGEGNKRPGREKEWTEQEMRGACQSEAGPSQDKGSSLYSGAEGTARTQEAGYPEHPKRQGGLLRIAAIEEWLGKCTAGDDQRGRERPPSRTQCAHTEHPDRHREKDERCSGEDKEADSRSK